MDEPAADMCCHACREIVPETEAVAALHCSECGRTYTGDLGGQDGGTMDCQYESDVPSRDDGDECPGCGHGELDGGVACPHCHSGGAAFDYCDTCCCGHQRVGRARPGHELEEDTDG